VAGVFGEPWSWLLEESAGTVWQAAGWFQQCPTKAREERPRLDWDSFC
jgi:hypothetical protein